MITGTILAVEKANDAYENLVIWVVFTDAEGNEINLGKEKDGHKVWPLLCKWEQFIGKTEEEVEAWLKANIEYQCENVIKAIVRPIINEDMVTKVLPAMVGKKWSKTDAAATETIKVDLSGAVVV